MWGGRRPAILRTPLEAALESELHELELLAAKSWLLFGSIGFVASLLFAAAVSLDVGLACAAATALYCLWFLFVVWWLSRRELSRSLRIVATSVEATIPWVFLVALHLARDPGYSIVSWVPPMLFCLVVFGLTLRLRFTNAAAIGLAGALVYLVLYYALVKPALPAELASHIIYQPRVQVARAVSMSLAGLVAAVAGQGLRAAITRAEGAVRERELFGKYRLQREIARGGMATVFEALYCPEGGFERRVAVKRIHPHLAEQEKFVSFFRSEAEISSRLAHPNIVQVMDFGRVGESYFLAMEYVDGMTLSALLRKTVALREQTDERVVAAIGNEILAGLVHAHEIARGIDGQQLKVVHRDLCPQNVLLSKNGEVKITDFGVARALKDSAASHTKTIVGHASYIAPEQARGGAVDPRADLFPLGVMLWELLAGRQLFAREGEASTIQALLEAPIPSILDLRTNIDPGWDAVLARALRRDPEARYESAREMAGALSTLPAARAEGTLRIVGELVQRLVDVDTSKTRVDTEVPTSVDAAPTLIRQ